MDKRAVENLKNPTVAAWLYRRAGRSLFLVGVALALGGCATFGMASPPPVTVADVQQMIRNRVPTDTILQKMRDSGTVYRLSASQLARLHDQGVPDKILNYMQDTYLEAVRSTQSLREERIWELGEEGYPYRWRPYFWRWGLLGPSAER